MAICGEYKKTFDEATHCVFDGNLNDHDFRAIAIQRIVSRGDGSVTLSVSGRLPIKSGKQSEYVEIEYNGFFGKRKTTGSSFFDNKQARIEK